MVKGKDPYPDVTNRAARWSPRARASRPSNSFLPYLPLMTVFGMPSEKKHDIVLTDARIFFSLVTLLVAGAALFFCPADGRRKMRALQVIAILPTAALPLATGRRRHAGGGLPAAGHGAGAAPPAVRLRASCLGIVSAMKFTAWPLAALALFAARDEAGKRRRRGVMVLGMLVVAGPVVVPFALRGPWAFFDNVVLFPLGLSGVNSPAASPLPGHLIVTRVPVPPPGAAPWRWAWSAVPCWRWYLYRRPPQTAAQACAVGGVVMAVITLFAPATRIGYLLYPINFFVWSYLFAGTPGTEQPDARAPVTEEDLQLSLSAP